MEKLKLLRPALFQKQKQPEEYVPVIIKNLTQTNAEIPAILQTQNKPLVKDNNLTKKFALCFLTYGAIMHPKVWEPYIQNSHMYIHPKYKNEVAEEHKQFIIPTIIDTAWAQPSIVQATILLLKEAIKTTTNEWFILCSGDSFPLKSFSSFSKYLNSQTLTIFNVADAEINKTSQWWAMCRTDVELILQNETDFNKVFESVDRIAKNKISAIDELFFLTALKTFNPEYNFSQGWVHYVKWLPNVVSKHPAVFNRLLEEDTRFIKSNNCLFIRKTFPTFQNSLITKKPVCVIICVGSESREDYTEFLDYAVPKANIFVLSFIDFVSSRELIEQCDQMYSAVWNQSNQAISVIYNKFVNQYSKVITLLDTFKYRNIQYPSIHADNEWSFLYSQLDNTYRLPIQKEPEPEARIISPLMEEEEEEEDIHLGEEKEEDIHLGEEKEEEPGIGPTKTKKKTTGVKKVGTRKIKLQNKDIAHVAPAKYIKFWNGDLNKRLPPQKANNIVAHPMYMNNRKIFINIVNQMFKDYRDAGLDIEKNVSCDDLKKSDTSISLLNHQRIIRDYMNLITPYRGLLLYHGLGAGKTCSSIAIAEGFKSDKNIIIMTPASLNPNYMEELKKCGDEYYKKQQYWEWVAVDDSERLRDTLSTILQLPKEYIDKNNGAWVVDITKPSNYDILKRPGENDTYISTNQNSLNNQLDAMILTKYRFINYNGFTATKYNELSEIGNPFDNKVVIIDEAHNLISNIVNKLNALYSVKQQVKLKSRKLVPMAINIYKDLMTASNARIVLLTGTPIINFPNEIGVLFNILRGYIKTYEFTLASAKSITLDVLKQYFVGLTMLDYIDYNQSTNVLTITINPFGFETTSQGVKYNPETEHLGERQFPARITDILKQKQVDVTKKESHLHTALPDSIEGFLEEFIKSQANNMYEFNNPMKFKKRIIGLTSYFRSAQEELLPRYDKATDFYIVRVPMSDFQFAQYEIERFEERKKEQKQKGKKTQKKPTVVTAGKEMQIESSSTFKIYSRLLCNFATPAGLKRPKRPKRITEDAETDDVPEDVDEMLEIDNMDIIDEAKTNPDLYNREMRQFIDSISENVNNLTGIGLETNSPKMMTALQNIRSDQNDGLHLVYSQFRTYEGIEMFARVLNANGFAQFKIKTVSRQWTIDILPEDMHKPKYALYTGTESTDEREILRNIYNGSWKNVPKTISDVLVPLSNTNNMGQHIKVLMITAAGSEGINLFNTRFVHLLEPYWNNVRLEQVVGRARRICSHQSLPIEKQTVNVFLYLSVLTEAQYTSSDDLKHFDISKLDNTKYFSSDETLYEISCIKESLNTKILHAVKEASIDCATHVNSSSRENLTCLSFGNLQDPTAFSYLPDISKDVPDEVYNQNVELIRFDDYQEITRQDGVKLIRQKSTGIIYTYESFKRAQQTKNIGDLIINTQ